MTDKPTPTTDLLKRCAEIHEWRSTGVLSGEALRDYAKRKCPDRHDTLQMAEHETVTEALALLAKWGQPAQAAEPVAWLDPWTGTKVTTDYDAYGKHGIPLVRKQPVAREPLPKFLALKFHARRDKKATVTLLFPGHEAADAWVRGIRGGQHGTE